MARQAFFATVNDCLTIFDHLFSTTDCCLYESYSEFDQPLRKYCSPAEAKQAFAAGKGRHDVLPMCLCLWSPTVMSKPIIERIKVDSRACDGHTFRYAFQGPISLAFHFGGISGREITYSEFAHFDEAGAKARGFGAGVDWPALRRLSNKIQYHIRGRLSVAKVPGHAVLPEALERAKKGHVLIRHALLQWRYGTDSLEALA